MVVFLLVTPVLMNGAVKIINEPSNHEDEETDQLIVKGTEVVQGEYPFLVALKRNGRQFCGGTIVTSNAVLTACHCVVVSFFPLIVSGTNSIRIIAGTVDIMKKSEGSRHVPKRITAHPKCWPRDTVSLFDVAVILIRGFFEPKRHAVSIKPLPNYDGDKMIETLIKNKDTCVTMGWGWDMSKTHQEILRKIIMIIPTRKKCEELISNIKVKDHCLSHQLNPMSEICALAVRTNRTTCYGDSGMPMLCGAKQELVGIVSGAPGDDPCGKENMPLLFARLDTTKTWISSQINDWTQASNVNTLAPSLYVSVLFVAYSISYEYLAVILCVI